MFLSDDLGRWFPSLTDPLDSKPPLWIQAEVDNCLDQPLEDWGHLNFG